MSPADHTVASNKSSEPRFSEDDLDAALAVVRKRADTLGDSCDIEAAVMLEAAEQFHRFLLETR